MKAYTEQLTTLVASVAKAALAAALVYFLWRHTNVEVGDVYLRLRVGRLVAFYSLDKHCAGWFVNRFYNCPATCRIHVLPTYHVVRLWDYDRTRCPA
jgi:hypothetical protein